MSHRALTCHEVIDLLSDYIEDSLSSDQRRRVDEHLARCDGCTAFLEQLRATIRAVGMLGEEQIPETQKMALLSAFRDWRG